MSNKSISKGEKIVNKGHSALSKISREVKKEEIGSAKLNKVIHTLKEELASQDDGVAIAAPQIGENLRLFVVAPNAFHKNTKHFQTVYINPKVLKFSKEKEYMLEGCLSVRWLYGEVERSKQIMIESLDEHGKRHVRGASGLMSQIFQHEIDHLEGVLFDSKAIDLRDLPPEHLQKNANKK